MPHLLSALYPKLELKVYFGPLVNLLGRRELSGECETKKCCHVSGFVCLSPIMCSAISAAPGVQAVVICVVSVVHPCLATKEHQQQALQKLALGIFREEPDSCAIKTLVIKLYIATFFFFFFFRMTMRKQSTVHVVGDQSSVCGMIANLVAPIQASGVPKMCLFVFEGESKTAAYSGGSVELF